MNVSLTGAAVLLTFFASSASAALVTYQYSVKIDNLQQQTSGTTGWQTVNTSSVLGKSLSLGDEMSGFMTYDSNAPLHSYQPSPGGSGTYTLYDAEVQGFMKLGNEGLRYDSTKLIYTHGLVQIADNAGAFSGADLFSLSSYSFGPGAYSSIDLMGYDNTGKALHSHVLPAVGLKYYGFDWMSVSYKWNDAAGNALSATGAIVLQDVAVPEPGAIFLMLAGLGMLGFAAARRSGAAG